MKQTYKYADKIVCVSYGLEKEIRKLLNNKINSRITTIYNLVNNDKGDLIKKKYFKKKLKLLSIGRLVPNKNIKNIINAVSLLKDKVDFSLKIVGQGEQKDEIFLLIKKYKLENQCKIYDFVDDLSPFYSKSDIYITSSLHESFGNTLKKLHYKLPIIANQCPYGPREILEDGKLVN